MAIPNMIAEVERGKQDWPQDWRDAHTDGPNTEGFIRKLAARLYAMDPRFGLNGKRGNASDISDDALAVFDESGSAVDRATGRRMEIIDVIARAGAPDASPAWGVVGPGTDPSGNPNPGAWVKPASVAPGTDPIPTKPPCPDPSAHIPKPPKPYPGDRTFDGLGMQLVEDYAKVGRNLDFQSGTWFGRVIFDHLNNGLTMEQSIAKHRVDWQKVLGIG